jgi:hypothetical protein
MDHEAIRKPLPNSFGINEPAGVFMNTEKERRIGESACSILNSFTFPFSR